MKSGWFRLILLFAPYLFLLILFTTSIDLSSADIDQTIYVGAYDNPPKIFPDQNGEYIGIFPDLLNLIADEENWNIEYVACLWSDCLDKLQANEINIMVDMGYSDERDEIFDFNKVPIITNWAMSFSQIGVEYNSVEELNGTTVAVLKASIHTEGPHGIKALFNDFSVNATFIEVNTYFEVLENVNNETADFGVVNRLFALVNEANFDNIQRSFLVFNPVNLHFGFHQGSDLSTQLITTIDKHLLELLNDMDSEYYEIMNKYLYEIEAGGFPKWVLPTILSVIGSIIGLASLNIIFKKQLNRKTVELRELIMGQDKEIKNATQHLLDANEKLKDLDKLKSIFLASMSHELRTPLNSIIGFTRILLMGMVGDLNEEQKKQLTMVDNSSHHLLDLINDVLDISKIESESIQLSYKELKLNDLIMSVVNSVKPTAKEKGIEITLDLEDDVVIIGDERRISQIILNLLSNAIKFSDDGSIKMRMYLKGDDHFEIIVEDQGIGIKEEDIEIIFQPFQQADMSTTKKYEGTGLGLYICKKLSKLMGGDINMKSEFGLGTEISFHLPLKGGKSE